MFKELFLFIGLFFGEKLNKGYYGLLVDYYWLEVCILFILWWRFEVFIFFMCIYLGCMDLYIVVDSCLESCFVLGW